MRPEYPHGETRSRARDVTMPEVAILSTAHAEIELKSVHALDGLRNSARSRTTVWVSEVQLILMDSS